MAIVTQQSNGNQLTDAGEITALLGRFGIVYEQWDISKYDPSAQPPDTDDATFILASFADEVRAISDARGYQVADVIALRPTTPNLDAALIYRTPNAATNRPTEATKGQ